MNVAFITVVFGSNEDNRITTFDEIIITDGDVAYHARFKPATGIVGDQDTAHLHPEEGIIFYHDLAAGGYQDTTTGNTGKIVSANNDFRGVCYVFDDKTFSLFYFGNYRFVEGDNNFTFALHLCLFYFCR